jgi:hypothetical protein
LQQSGRYPRSALESREPADGSPLRSVAERLDDALLCFNLLQQELGLPAGAEPRYGRLLGAAREPMPAAG